MNCWLSDSFHCQLNIVLFVQGHFNLISNNLLFRDMSLIVVTIIITHPIEKYFWRNINFCDYSGGIRDYERRDSTKNMFSYFYIDKTSQ